MYPYDKRWKWWARGRHRHLVDGLRQRQDIMAADTTGRLARRLTAMRAWIVARMIFLVFLSFSVVASIASLLLGWFDPAETAIDLFRRAASATATIFSLAYFFTLRVLGQLEIDALMLADDRLSKVQTSPIGDDGGTESGAADESI